MIMLNGKQKLAKLSLDGENDLVFQFLIENPNRVISKQEVEDHIKNKLTKKISKIIENFGFRKDLRRMFFGNSTEKHTYHFIDKNITLENAYYYKLVQVDYNGTKHNYSTIEVYYSVSAEEQPSNFQLYQNYPNPFNGSTIIPFNLEDDAHVTISLYDVTGKLIKTLSNDFFLKGYNEFQFSPEVISSGIYFCNVKADGQYQIITIIYLK